MCRHMRMMYVLEHLTPFPHLRHGAELIRSLISL